MIVVTGAAGFIGSCMVNKLNNKGYTDIILVDDFTDPVKNLNLNNKVFQQKIDREVFPQWLEEHHRNLDFVYHLGARTDTTETRRAVFDKLNLNYSKRLWDACVRYGLPLVYASSAATYGAGEQGYDDNHHLIASLKPLNLYGQSKNDFDLWALGQEEKPNFWAGFKFFNVFGPNEYHKGRMASVVFHSFNKIRETGTMELFRSHNPAFNDGEQKRDFIYVKDVVNVLFYFMLHHDQSGIFNLGTGKARTFLDLARATFQAMEKEENIRFVDTPEDIRDKYQYFTEARMDKLRQAGYTLPFYSLEEAVGDYVQDYLIRGARY